LEGISVFGFAAYAQCPAGSLAEIESPFAQRVVDEVVYTIPGLSIQSVGLVVTAVPEPSTYALMLSGVAALGLYRRKRSFFMPLPRHRFFAVNN
jgi:hypothetical protein